MQIKSTTRSTVMRDMIKSLSNILFGGGKTSFKVTTAGATIGLSFATIIIAAIMVAFFDGSYSTVYIMLRCFMISGTVGVLIALISLVGLSEWNTTYGFGMWCRIISYNALITVITVILYSRYPITEVIDPVDSITVVVTDDNSCKYKTVFAGKIYTRTTCSNERSDLIRLSDAPTINLVINLRFGGILQSSHIEYVDTVIRKSPINQRKRK